MCLTQSSNLDLGSGSRLSLAECFTHVLTQSNILDPRYDIMETLGLGLGPRLTLTKHETKQIPWPGKYSTLKLYFPHYFTFWLKYHHTTPVCRFSLLQLTFFFPLNKFTVSITWKLGAFTSVQNLTSTLINLYKKLRS